MPFVINALVCCLRNNNAFKTKTTTSTTIAIAIAIAIGIAIAKTTTSLQWASNTDRMTSVNAPAETNDARLGSSSNGHQQRRHCSQRKRKLYGNGNASASLFVVPL